MPEPQLSRITKRPLKISHSAWLATFKTRQNCLGQAFHLTWAAMQRNDRCQGEKDASGWLKPVMGVALSSRVCVETGRAHGWQRLPGWSLPSLWKLVSHDIKYMCDVGNGFGVFYSTWILFVSTQFLNEQLFCWLWTSSAGTPFASVCWTGCEPIIAHLFRYLKRR